MKIRKMSALVAAFVALALMAMACNKTESLPNTNANSSLGKSSDSTSGKTINSSPGTTSASSPTEVAKAFFNAVRNKDVPGIKNTMSKKSLSMLEESAKARNKNVDDVLKEGPGENFPTAFESKDENISGDTATLQVKGNKDAWDTFAFVKEDGQWKIAFDQMK